MALRSPSIEPIRTSFAPLADNTTRKLAAFVVRTGYADLDPDLVHTSRRGIMDCLGVSIGAADDPSVAKVVDLVTFLGGEPQATVWTTDVRSSLANAVLINAHLAHVIDFDDTFLSDLTTMHGNTGVVPAALAVGEWTGASGADLITACTLGYEVEVRIALSGGRALHRQRWHITSIVAGFGAAVAAGKILGLDEQQMAVALGIAGTQAGGLIEVLGTMSKAFQVGRAATNGILAALLARQGFTGPDDILTGKWGFHAVFHSDRNFDELVGELGSRWNLRNEGLKRHACGINQHATLDGVIALRERHHLKADDVQRIELRINPHVLVPTGIKEPKTGLEGKFSIYHTAAVALIDGAAGPAQFTDERVTDPAVIRLRERVGVVPDEAIHRDEARVSIHLADGTVLEQHVEHAAGTAANPLTDDQVRAKFNLLSNPVLGPERTSQLLDTLGRLETLPNVAALARLLAR
jgi:2-methylcitrate dehydratase PrpD